MEEERAESLIHEHYPLSFPHPFGSKVDARAAEQHFYERDRHPRALLSVYSHCSQWR